MMTVPPLGAALDPKAVQQQIELYKTLVQSVKAIGQDGSITLAAMTSSTQEDVLKTLQSLQKAQLAAAAASSDKATLPGREVEAVEEALRTLETRYLTRAVEIAADVHEHLQLVLHVAVHHALALGCQHAGVTADLLNGLVADIPARPAADSA